MNLRIPTVGRHRLFRLGALLFLGACIAGAADPATPARKPDPWAPLRPLLGEWIGEASGQSGRGTATRTYRFALRDRFIEVLNRSEYPAQEKNPKGEVHEDRGFFSYDRAAKKLVLRQFHVEGFVNTFALENVSADGRAVTFVTTAIENLPAGWRARETYTLTGPDAFTETFALAEPGKDFETYSETHFRRRE